MDVQPNVVNIPTIENPDGTHSSISQVTPFPIAQALGLSAYGDQSVAEDFPLAQVSFAYGINSRIINTQVNDAAGSITASGSLAVCSTGAAASSRANLTSKFPVQYNPGTGTAIRFTMMCTAPVSGSEQFGGLGNLSDGYFFGFIDTTFGIHLIRGGVSHVESFVFTAGSSDTSNITITLDGDAQTVATVSGNDEFDIARAIKAAAADFALLGDGWDVFIAGDTIEFVSFTDGVKAGAFSLGAGATGVTATVSTDLAGVASSITTVAQSLWNADKMDGTGPSGMTLDQTKLNVYKIQFEFLGAGSIEYFIEDDTTGRFVLVHRINYANNNIITSVANPTLPLCLMSKNTTNTTDIRVSSGSMSAFAQGIPNGRGIVHSVTGNQSVTTEQGIVILHFPPIFNSRSNRVIARPISVNLEAEGNKAVTFRIYVDPVIGGSPIFSDVSSTTTPTQVSTTGATTATGDVFAAFTLAKSDSRLVDLSTFGVDAVAGTTIMITATSSVSSDVSASIIFQDFI